MARVTFMARKRGRRVRVSFEAKGKKRPSAWAKNAKKGDCRQVRNPRTGKTIWLCKTGRGKTGFQFRRSKMK